VSEVSKVERREVGYRFHIAVDKELRTETGAKYPDKTQVHASLEGHADSFEEAVKQLRDAKVKVNEVLREA